MDDALGCHMEAQLFWKVTFYCDDRAQPNPPASFECGDRCSTDADCCDTDDATAFCRNGYCDFR
jgi:hypothetical protein